MSTISDAVDGLLFPIDEVRALRTIMIDLDRYAKLDPKVAEARSLMRDRLDGLTSQEERDDKLTPILWLQLRGYLQNPGTLNKIRQGLQNGNSLLPAVERSLTTTYDQHILMNVMHEGEVVTGASPEKARQVDEARQDLNRLDTADNPVLALALAAETIAIAVVIVVVVVVVAEALLG